MNLGDWYGGFQDLERRRKLELEEEQRIRMALEQMRPYIMAPTPVEPQVPYVLSDYDKILLIHYRVKYE